MGKKRPLAHQSSTASKQISLKPSALEKEHFTDLQIFSFDVDASGRNTQNAGKPLARGDTGFSYKGVLRTGENSLRLKYSLQAVASLPHGAIQTCFFQE
jgi:hypothetical protein